MFGMKSLSLSLLIFAMVIFLSSALQKNTEKDTSKLVDSEKARGNEKPLRRSKPPLDEVPPPHLQGRKPPPDEVPPPHLQGRKPPPDEVPPPHLHKRKPPPDEVPPPHLKSASESFSEESLKKPLIDGQHKYAHYKSGKVKDEAQFESMCRGGKRGKDFTQGGRKEETQEEGRSRIL